MTGDGMTGVSEQGQGGSGVVERYLAAIVAHDWPAMADCVAGDVVRVGPYGDTYRGRTPYVDFIATLMPSLPGYQMEIDRVVYGSNGRFAAAELTETMKDWDIECAPLSSVTDRDAVILRIGAYRAKDLRDR